MISECKQKETSADMKISHSWGSPRVTKTVVEFADSFQIVHYETENKK